MSREIDDPRFDAQLEADLVRRTGLSWGRRGKAKRELIERAWKLAGAPSLEAYVADVTSGRASLSPLIEQIRVPESYLFRDPAQLAVLSERMRVAARESRVLRIWSAGCSSGEEVYTIAMMAAEENAHVEVLGTDLSEDAMAKARQGVYTPWSLRGPAKHRAMPFLVATEGKLRVKVPSLARVTFRTQNLVADPPELASEGRKWDVVLCRNVLIYFNAETREAVVRALASVVEPDGLLIFGPSDAPPALRELEPIVTDDAIVYRRRAEGEPIEPMRRRALTPTRSLPGAAGRDRTSARPHRPLRKAPPSSGKPGAKARASRGFVVPPSTSGADASAAPPRAPSLSSAPPPGATGEGRDGSLPSRILEGLGTTEDVLNDVSRLESSNPDDPRAECLKGLAAMELGAPFAAMESFRRALYLDPDLLVAHAAQATLFEQQGNTEGAVFSYRRIVALGARLRATSEVPLSNGARVADLVAHAQRRIDALGRRRTARSR